jgi:hypothetical protein
MKRPTFTEAVRALLQMAALFAAILLGAHMAACEQERSLCAVSRLGGH